MIMMIITIYDLCWRMMVICITVKICCVRSLWHDHPHYCIPLVSNLETFNFLKDNVGGGITGFCEDCGDH